MRESIFNKSIKDIAKALVKATDGNIKQTAALNILAKMDGFPSYNKECREFANYEQNIKESLEESIAALEVEWKALGKDSSIGKIEGYIKHLFDVIESYFVFNDNSKISIVEQLDSEFEFFEDGFSYRVYKNLIDIGLFRNFDVYDYNMSHNIHEMSVLKIYNSLKDTIYQEQNYKYASNNLTKEKLVSKHPSKVINWFKNFFGLKYSGYSDKYNHQNSLINNFLSNISVNIKLHYKELLLDNKDINIYPVDIDYVLPEYNIKIRLSYKFYTKYMLGSFYEQLFISPGQKDIKEYILNELETKNSSINREISMEYGDNNHFGICLDGVQFVKDDEEFEKNLSNSGLLINPSRVFDVCVNDLTRPILKKHSLFKYSCIEEGIENNIVMQELEFNSDIESFDFNENKDISFATYKYVFETLNNELVHLMNKTLKEVFCDILVELHKRVQEFTNHSKNIVAAVNEMKLTSLDCAIEEIIKSMKDNGYAIVVEKDYITDIKGNAHEIILIKDCNDYVLLSLNYSTDEYIVIREPVYEISMNDIKKTITIGEIK